VGGSYSACGLSSPLRDDDLVKPIGPVYFAGEHTAGELHGLMEGAFGADGARPNNPRHRPVKGEWRKIKCRRQGNGPRSRGREGFPCGEQREAIEPGITS
jgi:flavin-dependent amine oxidoreductase